MMCVDRSIASTACFESTISVSGSTVGSPMDGVATEVGMGASCGVAANKKMMKKLKGGEVIECRICQEEGDDSDMEAPCGCNGTLKFAHRKCIQKWCNKKGNIICEICNEVFSPNYSVLSSRPNPDVLAIDIRQSWGSRIDIDDSDFLAIAAAEQELLNAAEYEDYTANTNGISCCRAVGVMLMLLLLIRHILTATRDIEVMREILEMFNMSLEFIGICVPCFVIIRSCYLIQSRRRRQV